MDPKNFNFKSKNKKLIVLIILPIILSILVFSFYFVISSKQSKSIEAVEDVSLRILKIDSVLEVFDNPNIEIEDNCIRITLTAEEDFAHLDPLQQYIRLETFTKRLRTLFPFHTNYYVNNLVYKDVKIEVKINDQKHFGFSSKLQSIYRKYRSDSHLTLNQDIIYTTDDFKEAVATCVASQQIEKVNGYDDIEIFNYANKLFELMTNDGMYYRGEEDLELILENVCNKYQITPEQIEEINNKYYLISGMF